MDHNAKLKNEELNRISVDAFKNAPKTPVVVILDNIRSLNNIGSIFRTCDAFRIEAIHLCGITAQPPHREIQKTALGATDSVSWKYFKNTIESVKELKSEGYQVVSIEQAHNKTFLQNYPIHKAVKYALVFGHEVNGVSQEIVNESHDVIEIPQYGTKHSFNLSVSVGIVLWEFNKRLN